MTWPFSAATWNQNLWFHLEPVCQHEAPDLQSVEEGWWNLQFPLKHQKIHSHPCYEALWEMNLQNDGTSTLRFLRAARFGVQKFSRFMSLEPQIYSFYFYFIAALFKSQMVLSAVSLKNTFNGIEKLKRPAAESHWLSFHYKWIQIFVQNLFMSKITTSTFWCFY